MRQEKSLETPLAPESTIKVQWQQVRGNYTSSIVRFGFAEAKTAIGEVARE